MTEDELLLGITEALTLAGWRWTHIRRSDGVTMGHAGLPDVIAASPTRNVVLAWELKTERGIISGDQLAWMLALDGPGIDARIIRPAIYDAALEVILRGVPPARAFGDDVPNRGLRPPSSDAPTFVP